MFTQRRLPLLHGGTVSADVGALVDGWARMLVPRSRIGWPRFALGVSIIGSGAFLHARGPGRSVGMVAAFAEAVGVTLAILIVATVAWLVVRQVRGSDRTPAAREFVMIAAFWCALLAFAIRRWLGAP